MTLEDIADGLYALPPEEFTPARAVAAAAAADRGLRNAVKALRKPTVGAWLVNTLARVAPELLEQLLSLGPELAAAQSAGQGDALRELGEQRRQLVGAVTARAFELAGRTPAAAARAEVESTLEAALADPASAEAVRSGRLVRALSYAGFGGVDVTDAVAAAPARARRAAGRPAASAEPVGPSKKDVAAAEARALETAGELDDAVRACELATRGHEQAEADQQRAADAVAAAEQALSAAREQRTVGESAARAAMRRVAKAQEDVKAAQSKAERARAVLDRLRRG